MWWKSGTPEEVIKGIRAYLANVAPPGNEPNPTRSTHEGEPSTFGGEFPARVVRFSGGSGEHHGRPDLPEQLTYQVRIYELAIGSRATESDGSREAEDSLITAWSQWVTAFMGDGEFRADVTERVASSFTVEAQDRFGRMFTDNDGQNNLLRLQADITILL